MMQRFVDGVLAIAKESVKAFTYECLNNIVRFINGFSALVLSILPGKKNILEGIHGWELTPTFHGPRFPRWMENGVSSFNQFIHELSVESNSPSSSDYGSSEEDHDDSSLPSTPNSNASRLSRDNSFGRHSRHPTPFIKHVLSWALWPAAFIFAIPYRIFHPSESRRPKPSTLNSSGSFRTSSMNSPRRRMKDHVVPHATDRRRGVVEDIQLAIEIFIEAIFDVLHKAAHYSLSPFATSQELWRWFFSDHRGSREDFSGSGDLNVVVPTSTLGDEDPTPTVRQSTFHQTLNTDARTCKDVITELGYPYEAIRVVTSDGYVLLLERIPRRDARKVVFLQHGVFDSSLGWVSNGVVGSPAFAAYDHGYDVFLGNFRGLVSREHVNKNISSQKYWKYSVNEHGIQDIPAMIEKIHEVKVLELKTLQFDDSFDETNDQPYKICAVCHSLGGAAILIYVVTRRLQNIPHRLSRLILLSPAGFHDDSTPIFTFFEYFLLTFAPFLAPFIHGFYIPTRFFRMLVNKLARDFHNYPALGGLVQTLISYVAGGDSSNWLGAIGLPHYNMNDMPGVSFYVALHLAQMKRSKKFIMYDFGSRSANMEAYGIEKPLDIGACYEYIDIPVDLVGGQKDKLIKPSMVRRHYELMKRAGVVASYREFEYAHLDFTFSHREELLAYVMSRLLLVTPPQ
ncbi:uncharacterized protein LOC18433608 [Amborella trichopoda]|uniref:uncharacterized protein LOC18433608 n=1 Tax=Amborella trichopoda TaxID=13333 RepID=UPI0005D34575|nr:uncharacterized protein LOC18433608 [Amborella trichopoda]|eukprot:XP_020522351.1 uncharacterized protein LOC18433608 [Amborella trichopoda]